jgi:hypothetical protein
MGGQLLNASVLGIHASRHGMEGRQHRVRRLGGICRRDLVGLGVRRPSWVLGTVEGRWCGARGRHGRCRRRRGLRRVNESQTENLWDSTKSLCEGRADGLAESERELRRYLDGLVECGGAKGSGKHEDACEIGVTSRAGDTRLLLMGHGQDDKITKVRETNLT